MKFGFIANNDLEGLRRDVQFCNLHGYTGLEFNWWGDFANVTAEHIGEMKKLLDSHSVECSTLGIWGWNHISADPAERAKCHAQLERAIEFAAILGSPTLIAGGGRFKEGDLAGNVAEYAKVMPPLLDKAAAKGLKVCLYGFHGGSFLDTVEGYELLWEKLPQVGIKLDPANINHAGQDYLDVLRRHGDKVYHVHIKEHTLHNGELAAQPAAGMGDIQWGKIFAFLYEADYQAYLTAEPHGPIWGREPMRSKMLVLTKRYLHNFVL